MKLRSTLPALLAVAGLALAGAGPAAAHQDPGPTLDVTFSGPSGVVWAGQCPAYIYEDDTDYLSEQCKPHGGQQIAYLKGLGVTKAVSANQGKTVFDVVIAPDYSSYTVTTNPWAGQSRGTPEHPMPLQTETSTVTCPMDGDTILSDQCVKNGGPATAASKTTKKSIKHTKKAKRIKKVAARKLHR
jgi:hypothetical protein